MLQNFLTITLRNMGRQPMQAIQNLACLTIGIAASLLIVLYIDFELTYDRFHTRAPGIYRVETKTVNLREKVLEVNWPSTPNNFGAYIIQDYPEVEKVVRFYKFFRNAEVKFRYAEQLIDEKEVYAADASVFDVFSFEMLAGDAKQAFVGPNKIVLSESLARRIFGKENPLGKTLQSKLIHNLPDMPEDYSFMVTGVYRDLRKNTHLPLHALISASTDPGQKHYHFGTYQTFTYLLLPSSTNAANLAPKLTQIYNRYLDPAREPVMVNAVQELIPITGIHMKETGGLMYVYIFCGIGLLLMLIAIISYVNLVTAQASRRAMEIGIRKVLGSHRKQLISQFLTESLFFTLLALFLAVLFVILSITRLNEFLGLQLGIGQLWQPQLLLSMLGIVCVIGLLGGSYPAFFLSSFEPIAVMKGKVRKGTPLRRTLVAVQFAVAIFVLCCTGIIYEQLTYLRNKELGFDKEHIIRLTLAGQVEKQQWPALKNTLLQSPYIEAVASGNFIPGTDEMVKGPISADNVAESGQQFAYQGGVDENFLATMNILLKEGRNFSVSRPRDYTNAVIVNETFLRTFGLKNALGEKVRYGNKDNPDYLEIIGVVADFHQNTLHTPIEAQLFRLKDTSPNVVIKAGKDIRAAISHLEKSWQLHLPNSPLDYRFLDQELQDGYIRDQIRGRLFLSFSLLTLFISFLGLFGLASYLARQRTKEVSIRKILGAGTFGLIVLLTKDFLLLVTLAALPAFALALYVITKWLENFTYHTDLNYFLLGWVLLFTLLLTFVTTGLHAWKTSRLNPAQTLKHE
jgi:putative ABC transport system permease protein